MKINFVFENELLHLFILNSVLLLQGLILSNALRAQKNTEEEGCTMALNNLRSEVIELRNEGLEKDKILTSLLNKIKEDEASSKAQAEAQKSEIERPKEPNQIIGLERMLAGPFPLSMPACPHVRSPLRLFQECTLLASPSFRRAHRQAA
jgi:hypothetical protein